MFEKSLPRPQKTSGRSCSTQPAWLECVCAYQSTSLNQEGIVSSRHVYCCLTQVSHLERLESVVQRGTHLLGNPKDIRQKGSANSAASWIPNSHHHSLSQTRFKALTTAQVVTLDKTPPLFQRQDPNLPPQSPTPASTPPTLPTPTLPSNPAPPPNTPQPPSPQPHLRPRRKVLAIGPSASNANSSSRPSTSRHSLRTACSRVLPRRES